MLDNPVHLGLSADRRLCGLVFSICPPSSGLYLQRGQWSLLPRSSHHTLHPTGSLTSPCSHRRGSGAPGRLSILDRAEEREESVRCALTAAPRLQVGPRRKPRVGGEPVGGRTTGHLHHGPLCGAEREIRRVVRDDLGPHPYQLQTLVPVHLQTAKRGDIRPARETGNPCKSCYPRTRTRNNRITTHTADSRTNDQSAETRNTSTVHACISCGSTCNSST